MIRTGDAITFKMEIDNENLLKSSISYITLFQVHYLNINQRADKMIAWYGEGIMDEVFFYDPYSQDKPRRTLRVEKNSVSCRLKPAWLKPGQHLFYIKIEYKNGKESLSSECVVDAV